MSSSEQSTHFAAKIGHVLNDRPGVEDHSKFTVVRKLGAGSRSSVWLVRNTSSKEYYAAKIYTVEASPHAERAELPILKKVNNIGSKDELPTLRRNFWEGGESSPKHFCALFDPTSTSVLDLLQETEDGKLPLRAVQKIVRMVALGLKGLQSAQIMHGGIKPENIAFFADSRSEVLDQTLESSLASAGKPSKDLPTEPITHRFKWKGTAENISDWGLILNGFGHAQHGKCTPDKTYDYYCAPETLLNAPSCSTATDIWMLGYTAVHLLTGSAPFQPKRAPSKTLAYVFSVLGEAPEALPEAWVKDRNLGDFAAAASAQSSPTLKDMLTDALPESDVDGALAFVKACMKIDPKERLNAEEILEQEWLSSVYRS